MGKTMLTIVKIVLSFLIIPNIDSSSDIPEFNSSDFEDHQISINYQDYHSVSLTTIKFLLYLPQEKNNTAVKITSNHTHLLNNTQPTKILIHGIGAFHDQIWIDQMVSIYHSKGNYNIIAVDWTQISTKDSVYIASAINDVGKVVGNFLIEVTEVNVEFLDSVHLIGSSVGAHVGAIAGENVENSGKGKIDRITGLDPEKPNNLGYINKDNAIFVDVIHTIYGEDVQGVGTVDIFVNIDNNEDDHDNEGNGFSAENFYILSINEDGEFEAILCNNVTSYVEDMCTNNTKIVIGESIPRNISGTFYMTKGVATTMLPQKYKALILTCLTIAFSYYILQ